jgi:hypothetical protein
MMGVRTADDEEALRKEDPMSRMKPQYLDDDKKFALIKVCMPYNTDLSHSANAY